MRARSRPAHPAAASARPSTISFCASRKSWVNAQFTPERAPFVPNLSTEPTQTKSRARRRESVAEKSARAEELAARLARAYPDVECPLLHDNAFQLLAAVILSAQCTDAAVNKVTPELFRRFP